METENSAVPGRKIFLLPQGNITVVLTELEILILEQLVIGAEDKEVSVNLNMKIYTLKTHLKRLYIKLKARNRTHAVIIYLQLQGRLIDSVIH